jgi:hypothetical protein
MSGRPAVIDAPRPVSREGDLQQMLRESAGAFGSGVYTCRSMDLT